MISTLLALVLAAALPSPQSSLVIEASEDVHGQFPGAPHIQSFAFADWHGRWVFIGGRGSGYHSVGGGIADFLRADANRDVWVVDTTITPARTYHAPLDSLPAQMADVKDQWSSTGLLYFADGATLYIAGGYGQDHQGNWVTFPLLSRVDLPRLVDGVMNGQVPADAVSYSHSPLVQSTGGRLMKLADGYFYLVMGHSFMGSYTAFEGQDEKNAPPASQEYLNEIRKLKFESGPGQALAVTPVDTFRDADQFHRRDLNVLPIASPAGLGLAAYGGVFTPEQQLGYSKPVYLFPNTKPVVDTAFDQSMNVYDCATIALYDRASETMYSTFFGGISEHFWDAAKQAFVSNARTGSKAETVYLDGMQWSDQISTIRRVMTAGKEKTEEFVQLLSLPTFLGADAVFIPAPEVARAISGTQILDWQALKGKKTFVGYIYGGIQASPYRFPYLSTSTPYNAGTIPTQPSQAILKVYATVP